MACCHNHDKKCYSGYCQVVLSFFIGILLGPWSYGLLFLLISIIIGEIVWMYFHGWDYLYRIERPLAILAAMLGWAIGRYATKTDITESGYDRICQWYKCYIKKYIKK